MLLAAFSGAVLAANAEPPPELITLCKTTLCRKPTIHLNLADGQEFTDTQPFSLPILQDGWISIYPGEEIYIEAQIEKGELSLLRAVPALVNPDRTLVFKFHQRQGTTDMFLEVTNPFQSDLKFKFGMMLPDSDRVRATSSCPVSAGLKLFEHWPHPIYQLVIGQGRALKKGDPRDCAL